MAANEDTTKLNDPPKDVAASEEKEVALGEGDKAKDDASPLEELNVELAGEPAATNDGKRDVQEEETPPPKPPRPLTTFEQTQLTLTEAFPSVQSDVVRALLIASGGEVDPAFNGLLSLTDPDYKLEESLLKPARAQVSPPPAAVRQRHQPSRGALRNSGTGNYHHQQQQQQQVPPHPSRYRAAAAAGVTAGGAQRAQAYANAAATIRSDRSQIEEDERLARMLAAEEGGQTGPRRVRYADTGMGTTFNAPDDYQRSRPVGRRSAAAASSANNRGGQYDDDDRSFFDEGFPQLKEDLTKGFNETKETVSNWFGNLRKKMDLDEPFGALLGGNSRDREDYNDDDDYEYRRDDYYRSNNNNSKSDYNNNNYSSSRGYQSGPARASRARDANQYYDNDDDDTEFNGIKMSNEDIDGPALPKRPLNSNSSNNNNNNAESEIKSSRPSATAVLVPVSGGVSDSTTASAAAAGGDKKILLKSSGVAEEEDPFFIGDSEDEDEEEDVPLSEVAGSAVVGSAVVGSDGDKSKGEEEKK